MFNDCGTENILSWWLCEKDYGRNKKMKIWDEYDNEIDLSTAEKLYDYLLKEMKKGTINERF